MHHRFARVFDSQIITPANSLGNKTGSLSTTVSSARHFNN